MIKYEAGHHKYENLSDIDYILTSMSRNQDVKFSEKFASLVQQELGILMLGLELPAMTTISKVEVTPDLKHAKVWITILDAARKDEVLETLKANLYDMQGELNRKLKMHHVPRVNFVVDGGQRGNPQQLL